MNKERRKRKDFVCAKLYELLDEIECLKEDEELAYDNMPESLQNSEKGKTMEDNISNFEEVFNYIEEAINNLENIE